MDTPLLPAWKIIGTQSMTQCWADFELAKYRIQTISANNKALDKTYGSKVKQRKQTNSNTVSRIWLYLSGWNSSIII